MNFANVKTWTISEGEVLQVKDSNNTRIIWQKQSGPDYSEPFYVQNITNANETLSIKQKATFAPALTIEYLDGTRWKPLCTTSTTAYTQTLQPGEKIYLRCSTDGWGSTTSTTTYNVIRGVSKVGGNIMSLLYGSNFDGTETILPQNQEILTFYGLFSENTALINAEDLLLPATTLSNSCYDGMFSFCRALVAGPKILPATTLTSRCYYQMFYVCESLLQTPEIMATTMANSSCSAMFGYCTSLTKAMPLHTITLANYCCDSMFTACTSLTTAPEIPATVLVNSCYQSMFSSCTSLNYVKCLATSGINTNYSTRFWLSNVSSTGTFVKAAGVTWPSSNNGIPSGWTVQEV